MQIKELFGSIRSVLHDNSRGQKDLFDSLYELIELGHGINAGQFDGIVMPYIQGHLVKTIVQKDFWDYDPYYIHMPTYRTKEERIKEGYKKRDLLDLFQIRETMVLSTWAWQGEGACGRSAFLSNEDRIESCPIARYIDSSEWLETVHFELENDQITQSMYQCIIQCVKAGRNIGFMPVHMTNDGGDYMSEILKFVNVNSVRAKQFIVTCPDMPEKRLGWYKSKFPKGVTFR